MTKAILFTPVNGDSMQDEFEKSIIPSQWEEKDTDLVVQHMMDKKLNLESVSELS